MSQSTMRATLRPEPYRQPSPEDLAWLDRVLLAILEKRGACRCGWRSCGLHPQPTGWLAQAVFDDYSPASMASMGGGAVPQIFTDARDEWRLLAWYRKRWRGYVLRRLEALAEQGTVVRMSGTFEGHAGGREVTAWAHPNHVRE